MEITKVRFAYFTPIMLTRKIVYNIVSGASRGTPTEQCNLTAVKERERDISYAANELLIAALPSFGGRAPVLKPALLRNLHGNNTPAVAVVTYGNHGYGDTLLEMKEVLKEQGFVVFAGGAFVTMHSMVPKVGHGRPNFEDLNMARTFGGQIRDKLDAMESPQEIATLPGNTPFKPAPPPFTIVPQTNEKCVLCMQCHRWCPVDAIPYNDPNRTEADRCILCHGCIVRCPVKARTVEDAAFKERIQTYEANFAGNNLQSEVFI